MAFFLCPLPKESDLLSFPMGTNVVVQEASFWVAKSGLLLGFFASGGSKPPPPLFRKIWPLKKRRLFLEALKTQLPTSILSMYRQASSIQPHPCQNFLTWHQCGKIYVLL